MKQFCLALDLKNDPALIDRYEAEHRQVWPEVIDSIQKSGINLMQIYRTGNRLFMIILADDDFSFEKKAAMDAANPVVQEWERLMDIFQQRLPWAAPEEKWVLMDLIFEA